MIHTELTEAFHAIYDVKDKLPAGGSHHYAAYEAIQKLSMLMESLGWDVPNRHDGEGRTDGTEKPWLTLTEGEAVEVYAALALAAQVYALTGDTPISSHYQGLNAVFQGRDGANRRQPDLTEAPF